MFHSRFQRVTSRRRTIVAALALVFLLAACGTADDASSDAADEGIDSGIDSAAESGSTESNETDGQATASAESDGEAGTDGDGSAAGSITELDVAAAEESAKEFSQCIRDQGVDLPDLTIGEDGQLDLANLIATVDPADPAVQQAILTCQGSLNGGLAGSLNQILESETFADALVSFSQCVRDGGYDVADLTFAAVVSATLGGDIDSSAGEDSVAPILASAMGLDPADGAVIETIDGCVVLIRNSLGDLGLGS